MSAEYGFGLGVGILIALLFALIYTIVRRVRGGRNGACEFDERQNAGRGIAFRNGMFTMAGCNTALALLELSGSSPMDSFTALLTSMIIGIGVFAVTAIRLDAYQALNRNLRSWYLMGIILAAANLIPGILNIAEGKMFIGGKLGHPFTSLLLGLLWTLILFEQFFHSRKLSLEAEED